MAPHGVKHRKDIVAIVVNEYKSVLHMQMSHAVTSLHFENLNNMRFAHVMAQTVHSDILKARSVGCTRKLLDTEGIAFQLRRFAKA